MTQTEFSFTAASRRDARAKAGETAENKRMIILGTLEMWGPLTADEIAEHLQLPPYQVRPRLTELRDAGSIRSIGRRLGISGVKIVVWEAVADVEEEI